MPKHFNVFRQMVLGYILIVGLCVGLITPIAQAEAPIDTLYNQTKTEEQLVDGLTQAERAHKIDTFFTVRGNLPMAGQGINFVKAADKYNVDWRLAAAFAYNESTAGLHECRGKDGSRTYNAFGYRGCNSKFNDYEHAIDTVTRNIAGEIASTAKYYKDKTTEEKIDAYNPPQYNAKYKSLVLWTMNKIGSMDSTKSSAKELAMK